MRIQKQTIVLGKEHKDVVIKKVRVDLKPTLKNDEPVTYHYFVWTGKTFKRIPRKSLPQWVQNFAEHYDIGHQNFFKGITYQFKGDRAMQPYAGHVTVLEV